MKNILIIDINSIPDDWEINKWLDYIVNKGVLFWSRDGHFKGIEPKIFQLEDSYINNIKEEIKNDNTNRERCSSYNK